MSDLPTILAELHATGAAAVATADHLRETAYALAPDLRPPTHAPTPAPADLDAIRDRLLLLLAESE